MKLKTAPKPIDSPFWRCEVCRERVPIPNGRYDIGNHLIDFHRDVWLKGKSVGFTR